MINEINKTIDKNITNSIIDKKKYNRPFKITRNKKISLLCRQQPLNERKNVATVSLADIQ